MKSQSSRGQVTPQGLLVVAATALVIVIGSEMVKGAKWLGHESKAVAHHIVHALKHL